ncbi:Uncharacterised protein [Vibrio cholerae]|nr:Uncharacterised protein [Vibrio cholerae]CSB85457.1 Uncharacterised protein [Vibrio cholerae]CSB95163.1 Uncharacterised protein [Vibrio cholerae]CSC57587.1 Uncharacterised protein [Vibrio cholerae]CSC73174.1 Uncharacterised protein [Vibrio cholerae]
MVVIKILEAVPILVWIEFPALGGLNVLGLPHIEEPAFALAFQTFDLFTEANRTINRILHKLTAGVATHHCSGSFRRCHNAVLR